MKCDEAFFLLYIHGGEKGNCGGECEVLHIIVVKWPKITENKLIFKLNNLLK